MSPLVKFEKLHLGKITCYVYSMSLQFKQVISYPKHVRSYIASYVANYIVGMCKDLASWLYSHHMLIISSKLMITSYTLSVLHIGYINSYVGR